MDNRKESKGAALAAAVVALFVLGALASTTFLLSFAERRVGRRFVRFFQATTAADAGAYAPLSSWDVTAYNRLEVGDSVPFTGNNADGTGFFKGTVTRLGARLFLVSSKGWSASGQTHHRVGTLFRLQPIRLTIEAALDIRGPLDLAETVRINGFDQNPYGWSCSSLDQSRPAIRIPSPDSGSAPWSGCAPARCLLGDPRFEAGAIGHGSGDGGSLTTTLADLRAVAAHIISGGNLRVQPVVSNGTCVTSDISNWGAPYDPQGACGDHFPAVYSNGDLVLDGGHGQGVLVVDGDLTVSGGFQFFGAVIVLGRFMSVGTGSQISGAVIVYNDTFRPQSIEGMTRIQYSSCAVDKSLAGSGRGVLLRERSWLDMY